MIILGLNAFQADSSAALVRDNPAHIGFEIGAAHCIVEEIGDEATLCQRTAAAIALGRVVGWFQGRMEWGPPCAWQPLDPV